MSSYLLTPKQAAPEQVDWRPILTELMTVLRPGVPTPEIKIINTKQPWLGICRWRLEYSPATRASSSGDNTAIELQKSILGDADTTRRVLAHELCHHEDDLLNEKPEFERLGFQTYRLMRKVRDGHGANWQAIANRFNAKYGADFVTKTSDQSYVLDDSAVKPYFVLMYRLPDGVIRFQQSSRLSPKQKEYLGRCEEVNQKKPGTFKLFQTIDRTFHSGALIGYSSGWSRSRDPQITAKINEQWQAEGALLANYAMRKTAAKYGKPPASVDPQTQSPAFRAWFAGSKVVDRDGNPLVVHHGTPDARWLKETGVFQSRIEQHSGKDDPTRAFFFAGDPEIAASYADDHRAWDYQNAEPGVHGFYLHLKNPLIVNNEGKRWNGTDNVVARAKAEGHDGVIIQNTVDSYHLQSSSKSTTVYVAFSSEQIKAVKGNTGGFDPKSKSVYAAKPARHYYHGSRKLFKPGFSLTPQKNGYVHTRDEDVQRTEGILEKYRPADSISRRESVFLTDDPAMCERTGGYGDHIYEVEPIGEIERSDMEFYSEVEAVIWDSADDPEAKRLAEGYWSGQAAPENSHFEYRCRSARVIRELKLEQKQAAGDTAAEEAPATDAAESSGFSPWFSGSKVVDSQGKPLKVYHGTGADIVAFNYEFAGQGNDQHGSGFYFTNNPEEAAGFAMDHKDKGAPNVVAVYLAIKNPIVCKNGHAEQKLLTRSQISRIIQASPVVDDVLTNFGDVEFEGRTKVLNVAIDAYGQDDNLLHQLHLLANDFYPSHVKEFNAAVRKAAGYDGVIATFDGKTMYYIAWFPDQIKSAVGNSGDFDAKNNSITAAVEAPAKAATESAAFKGWFSGSKIVDGEGNPLPVFHGTDAEFDSFDRSKSKSGPSKFGFWFTSDKGFSEMFGANQMEVFLRMRRPHKITSSKWNDIRDQHAKDTEWFERWRDRLREQGYDGLWVAGEQFITSRGMDMSDPSVFAVFSPGQIKSVKNAGDFDASRHSIYAAAKKSPFWLNLDSTKQEDSILVTRQELIGKTSAEAPDKIITRMNALLEELKGLPYSKGIAVFGSAARGKERPGDIDIFLDFSEYTGDALTLLQKYRGLLDLAAKYYGMLDPFLLVKGTLFTRSDDARQWIKAKNAKEIILNARNDSVAISKIAPFGSEMTDKQAAKSETDTTAFRNWFAGSKVSDTQGNPIMMYHGTKEPFAKVDMNQGAQGVFWLTSDREALGRGEVGAASSKTVLRCYVKITNPAGWDEYEKKGIGELKRDGYDGIILPDRDGKFDAVVFKPNQVRILPDARTLDKAAAKANSGLEAPKWLFDQYKRQGINPDFVAPAWEAIQGHREELAKDNLALAKEKGFEVTPDGNLVLYHGTRSGADIRRSGYLRPTSYLSANKADAERYAAVAQRRGTEEVFRLEVYPGYGALQGNGYFSTREPIPVPRAKAASDSHLTRPYYRGSEPGRTEKIRTGSDAWDACLFVADDPKKAAYYGKHIDEYRFKPSAKLLVEGTQAFSRIGRWRRGENLLEFCTRMVNAAKERGYDAVYFTRQGDVGTAVINREAIEEVGEYKSAAA